MRVPLWQRPGDLAAALRRQQTLRHRVIVAIREALLRFVLWLGHPNGGSYAKDLYICTECGALIKDTVWHTVQEHGRKP